MSMMHIRAEPFTAGERVREFDWDPETGDLSGPDAPWVRQCITDALDCGRVGAHPAPWSIAVSDPLHSLSEMAAVVGAQHRLPPELAAHYPSPPESDPSDVEVLY